MLWICVLIAAGLLFQGDFTAAQDLPLTYNSVSVTVGNDEGCPTNDQMETVRAGINQDIRTLIKKKIYLISPPDRVCDCGGQGWTRVAYLDMTDATQRCPRGWRSISSPVRTCGRSVNSGCSSATFRSGGLTYNRVCGRLVGYQFGSTEAFWYYNHVSQATIDSPYVDGGVSITHGSPRQHIWSLASGHSQQAVSTHDCRCNNGNEAVLVPPWVGEDYFCDSGNPNPSPSGVFYADDPLWDGTGCGPSTTCCEFNNPPWFCKRLPQATSDDIEVRLCGDEHLGNEDTPIEVIEIYVR